MQTLFEFPNPVNERSARLVAAGVVCMCLVILVLDQKWVLIPLAYGFSARVLTGPTLSPLGQLVTRVIVPSLKMEPKLVPGPPKRFAQGIGATLSISALLLYFVFDLDTVTLLIVGLICFAATLESVFGFCIGCTIFAGLMKLGFIPESICESCVFPRP